MTGRHALGAKTANRVARAPVQLSSLGGSALRWEETPSVVVVDDDPATLGTFARALRHPGHDSCFA
jgi:hypothetical protein